MEFINIWKVLYEHGATEWRKDECERLWNTYTAQQQQQIYSTITEKLKNGKFVHYNPVRAIRENLPREAQPEPTNYNGRALPDEPTATAFYNGKWGTYTLADIEKFGLRKARG